MRSLLAGVTAADIHVDPFPHIVARDPMDRHLYEELSAGFPPFSRIGWHCAADKVPNNRRYEMSAQAILDAPDMSTNFKEFAARHSEPEFLSEVASLFRGHWPEAMLAVLGGSFEGHSTGRLSYTQHGSYRIHQDARIEINTPVRERPSSSRGPHLDTPNRLFSCLFYMRLPEDDSTGGDLLFYRWRNGPVAPIDRHELPSEAVEMVATIPYRANQLVIFPQTINSIHGVGVRQPTPHMRRYVFLTAEIGEDWLTIPATSV